LPLRFSLTAGTPRCEEERHRTSLADPDDPPATKAQLAGARQGDIVEATGEAAASPLRVVDHSMTRVGLRSTGRDTL
jgi:hypothetical protein